MGDLAIRRVGSGDLAIKRVEWGVLAEVVEAQIRRSHITTDSFWEARVLEANHYGIYDCGVLAGWFAIYNQAELWLFHVTDQYGKYAQELFARAKQYEQVVKAMVTTGDELFMSLCIDGHIRVEKQAYFTLYPNELPEAKRLPITLRQIDPAHDKDTVALAGGFLEHEWRKVAEGAAHLRIYIAEHKGETVGFGVSEDGRVDTSAISIGMYVLEGQRQKGVAANILQLLKEAARARGLTPRSGCHYYNHNSKKAQEAAGGFAKTRLVGFYF